MAAETPEELNAELLGRVALLEREQAMATAGGLHGTWM